MTRFIVLLLLLIGTQLRAQIEHTSAPQDQILQGPCYVFSTIAALESKALEAGAPSDVNFNEWLHYSYCALNGLPFAADGLIEGTMNHVQQYGIYDYYHTTPANEDECPNPNDAAAGIAYFPGCPNTDWCTKPSYYEYASFEGGCEDNEGTNFLIFCEEIATKYVFSPDENGDYYKKVNVSGLSSEDKEAAVSAILDEGYGVIANFSSWITAPDTSHSVFIFRESGGSFRYKDSWPGNPGIRWMKGGELSSLSTLYYIVAKVTAIQGPGNFCEKENCNASIIGPSTIYGGATYKLKNGATADNIVWEVSDDLQIISGQGTPMIKVTSTNACKNGKATIKVTYGLNCSDEIKVFINNSTPTITGITVMSSQWNNSNNTTCPNTYLLLEADISPNSQAIYEWSIQGATLISGQGTPIVMVKTPSHNSFLNFKVRAKLKQCPWGPWVSKTGYSSSSNSGCGSGGGGLRTLHLKTKQIGNRIDFSETFDINQLQTFDIMVADVMGRLIYQGNINTHSSSLDLNNYSKGMVFVKIFNRELQVSESFKFLIK